MICQMLMRFHLCSASQSVGWLPLVDNKEMTVIASLDVIDFNSL